MTETNSDATQELDTARERIQNRCEADCAKIRSGADARIGQASTDYDTWAAQRRAEVEAELAAARQATDKEIIDILDKANDEITELIRRRNHEY